MAFSELAFRAAPEFADFWFRPCGVDIAVVDRELASNGSDFLHIKEVLDGRDRLRSVQCVQQHDRKTRCTQRHATPQLPASVQLKQMMVRCSVSQDNVAGPKVTSYIQ